MRVLVADKFEESGLAGIANLGVEIESRPELKDGALAEAIKASNPTVLIVRSTKVASEMMQGSSLKLIIRAGAGYNNIDIAAASEMGIKVSNCPGKNAAAVAELAFGLILAIDRRIPDNVSELRNGKWNKKEFSKARGLAGRTLGLVGMGFIGKEMVPRAKSFGMNVVAFSRHLSQSEAETMGVRMMDTQEALAQESDVVSVHNSLTPESKGSISTSFFNAMRTGAYFVNTSRAEVIDQLALIEALDSKKIFAGLDVFEGEPDVPEATYDGPLKNHARVYCTHHIGASTDQAQEAVAAETVRIVKMFKEKGTAENAVN